MTKSDAAAELDWLAASKGQSAQVATGVTRGTPGRRATVATVAADGTITTTDGITALRMAAYSRPAPGDVVILAQGITGAWYALDRIASGADSVGDMLWALKPTSTSRASTTTATDDPHLIIPVSANATYILEGWILSSSAGTHDGDLKSTIIGPTGSTGRWNFLMTSTTAGADPDMVRIVTTGIASTLAVGQPGTGVYGGTVTGLLITGSTAGNATYRWGQQTSSANATTIEADSWLRLTRIA